MTYNLIFRLSVGTYLLNLDGHFSNTQENVSNTTKSDKNNENNNEGFDGLSNRLLPNFQVKFG
jgi:hypothetical protein